MRGGPRLGLQEGSWWRKASFSALGQLNLFLACGDKTWASGVIVISKAAGGARKDPGTGMGLGQVWGERAEGVCRDSLRHASWASVASRLLEAPRVSGLLYLLFSGRLRAREWWREGQLARGPLPGGLETYPPPPKSRALETSVLWLSPSDGMSDTGSRSRTWGKRGASLPTPGHSRELQPEAANQGLRTQHCPCSLSVAATRPLPSTPEVAGGGASPLLNPPTAPAELSPLPSVWPLGT